MMGITLDIEMKSGNRKGRPNYPAEFKRRLAAAACEVGVSVSKLAQANGVNANMLFKWRREFRAGLFEEAQQRQEPAKLLPVVLAAAPTAQRQAVTSAQPASITAPGMIEIIIADALVRVHGQADTLLLKTIFESLRA